MTRPPRRLGLARAGRRGARARRGSRLALLAAAAGLALGLAAEAGAWVPRFEEIARAVAEANREADRAQPLALEVAVRFREESEPVATGTLVSDPSGRARLELRHERGFVERHLLAEGRLRASRDGEALESPRPFLPPLYLLQAGSPGALRRALRELGAVPGTVELGYVGEHDCFALGGRGPRPSGEPAAAPLAPEAGAGERDAAARRPPALWVDQESFAPVRIQRARGVRHRLGPIVDMDGVRLPAWLEVRSPGSAPLRLEIRGARPAEPQPGSFAESWLARPTEPEGAPRR